MADTVNDRVEEAFRRAYKNSENPRKIGLDVDSKQYPETSFAALRIFYSLKSAFPRATMQMEKSRHGYHIKTVGEDIEKIPLDKRLLIRESLGDDPGRLEHDWFKLKNGLWYLTDTLFVWKRDHDGIASFTEQVEPTALPWASKIPAKKPKSL